MSKSTTIVTTTTALSSIANDLLETYPATSRPSKQSLLNLFAHGICGAKHDWGFLTGASNAVIQKGIPKVRLLHVERGGPTFSTSLQPAYPSPLTNPLKAKTGNTFARSVAILQNNRAKSVQDRKRGRRILHPLID